MNEFMTIIEWWVVPIILFFFLVYVLFLTPPDEAPPLVKASARSGKWAGLVILALFVVSRKESNDTFSFTIPTYSFDYLTTIIATIIGGGCYHALTHLGTTRALGVFSFVLAATVSITLYSYFYVAAFRTHIVFCTLGVTLGILLQRMLFPQIDAAEGTVTPAREEKPRDH